MKVTSVISAFVFSIVFTAEVLAADAYTSESFYGTTPHINDSGVVVYYAPPYTGGTGAKISQGNQVSSLGTDPLNTSPRSISNSGIVTGDVAIGSGVNYVDTAFTYSSGTLQELTTPSGTGPDSIGNDVNDNGVVVGSVGDNTTYQATIWQNGIASLLPSLPGSSSSSANAINDLDVAIGYSILPDGSHATMWSGNTVTDLGLGTILDINNSGVMIGNAGSSNLGALWDTTGLHILPSDPQYGPFYPTAINDSDIVAGYVSLSQFPGGYGRLWENGTFFTPDNDVFLPQFPSDINNLGSIVGTSNAHGGLIYVDVLTPIPEPNTCFLLISGTLLSFCRRRR